MCARSSQGERITSERKRDCFRKAMQRAKNPTKTVEGYGWSECEDEATRFVGSFVSDWHTSVCRETPIQLDVDNLAHLPRGVFIAANLHDNEDILPHFILSLCEFLLVSCCKKRAFALGVDPARF